MPSDNGSLGTPDGARVTFCLAPDAALWLTGLIIDVAGGRITSS